MADLVAASNAAADAAGIPRLLLLAAGCAESNLNATARRPVRAADDERYWPDVSGGAWQQTVRWDPDYLGDAKYPGPVEIERVLQLQYDPARSARIAAANLRSRYRPTEADAVFKALCRYNWPAGNGTPANASVAANYRRGIAEAQTLLGGAVADVTTILSKAIEIGKTQTGKRYAGPVVGEPESFRWGDPGFDCSSFVSWCYQQATGGQVKLTAYTDAAYDQCEWVQSPQPGDVVFYHYADDSQPGVKFPHMGIWLSPSEVLDCRYAGGDPSAGGVGVHPHVTPIGPDAQGRFRQTMRPKGLATVPVVTPPSADPRDARIAELEALVAGLKAELDGARTKLGVLHAQYSPTLTDVAKAIAALTPEA